MENEENEEGMQTFIINTDGAEELVVPIGAGMSETVRSYMQDEANILQPPQEQVIDFLDDRTTIEFNEGDLVQIRSVESMAKQYGFEEDYIKCNAEFYPSRMGHLCGEKAIITEIVGERVALYFIGKITDTGYHYSKDMIELVERNYRAKYEAMLKKKKELAAKKAEEKKKSAKEKENEDIIQQMISQVDIKKIKKILSMSFKIPQKRLEGLDKLLLQWAAAKQNLFLLLDKHLKISKPIEYQADDNDWQERREQLCQAFPGTAYILNQLPTRSFTNNILLDFDYSWQNRYMPKAKEGMKLTTFLSQAFKNPLFDTELSKQIDAATVKGFVTISIDPIDYLLMSLNTSGWQSCHTIHENGRSVAFGCYVGGLFSYMCDKVTAISYRHSDKQSIYQFNGGKFMEYSKNWRQCIYIDGYTGDFVCSRQYPRNNETISKSVRELLEENISKYFNFKNLWSISRNRTTIKNYMMDYNMSSPDDWCGGDGALHYNDIWHGYDGLVARHKTESQGEDEEYVTMILVGSEPICPICGENTIKEHNSPCCEECKANVLDMY